MMSLERFDTGSPAETSNLARLARETPERCMKVSLLDLPIVWTQDNRGELPPLSDETRDRLEERNWPEPVLEAIGSEAEAQIYENADLEPDKVNNKDALIRTDIAYDQEDDLGRTNLERMQLGLAPLDADGNKVELHHIGQQADSPLAELTRAEHRGKGNDNVLHNKLKESEINREDFDKERKEYWKARAEEIEQQRTEG